ncbi:ribonuclease III [bacterium]|nr:ribonuclease III [bacterium]
MGQSSEEKEPRTIQRKTVRTKSVAPEATDPLRALEQQFGYSFESRELLLYALTHRSAATSGGESEERRKDYERLEFLGDAVLDLAISDFLLHAHPEAREGELSKMRAALVNTESLAKQARKLNLSNHILVSKAERTRGGHERPALLADVVESLIGAVYREAGFDRARAVVSALFGDKVLSVDPNDPKSELQEALHALEMEPPLYELEGTEGPEHLLTFITTVSAGGALLGRGQGSTKKSSQQDAARQALESLAPLMERQQRETEEQE